MVLCSVGFMLFREVYISVKVFASNTFFNYLTGVLIAANAPLANMSNTNHGFTSLGNNIQYIITANVADAPSSC